VKLCNIVVVNFCHI